MPVSGSQVQSLIQALDWSSVRVTSFVPGRVRLKSLQLRQDESLIREVEDALRSVDVLTAVSVNARTGSVLLYYDPDDIEDPGDLLDRAKAFRVLPDGLNVEELRKRFDRPAGGRDRDVNTEVEAFFRSVNRSVQSATGGSLDLRSLVSLGFAGGGVVRLLRGTAGQTIPWYNYFWFAFSIFLAFRSDATTAEDAADRPGPPEDTTSPADWSDVDASPAAPSAPSPPRRSRSGA